MQTTVDLRRIEAGMKVFDRANHEIGKVERVRFGEDDPSTPQLEANSLSADPDHHDSIIDNIAEAFHPDELPEEVRERLLQQGFVRLDADGLFASDRYITPDQIASVSTDSVQLNVSKDDLLKRH